MEQRKEAVLIHRFIGYKLSALCLLLLASVGEAANMTWCPQPCACYNQYTTVDCTNEGLNSLPRMSNLTHFLFLDGNNIGSLPANAFSDTPNLVKLHIQNSHLKNVTSTSFCSLRSLQELHLGNNAIATFPVWYSHECVLYGLKELSLHGNVLTEIPRNLSRFAPNLEMLNLSNNRIQFVQFDESFAELHALNILDFSLNDINIIRSNDFDPVRHGRVPLEVLRFTDCRLTFVDADALRGLDNLTALTLTESIISPAAIFAVFDANNTRLAHLDLSDMDLPQLTVGMLGMFQKLILLKAIDSRVSHIEPQLFARLHNLETLHLENNHLQSIENMGTALNLRRLYLSSNRLSELNLLNLTNLEVVDLSHNSFREIPARWLTQADNMLMLNLSHNLITAIDSHAFTAVSLNILDISYNGMEALHSFDTSKLRKLDISHNGLTEVSEDTFHQIAATVGEIDFSFNKLSQLPLRLFLEFDNLQRLSLSRNNFGKALHSGQLKELFNSLGHLQELDLSFNSIQSLPPEQLRSLHHLTTLILMGNQISDLRNLHLGDLPSLAKLILADNQLAAIQTSVLNQMGFLEVVDLSDNPYECSCAIYPFLQWLKSPQAIVLNLNEDSKYQCDLPPELAQHYILDPSVVPDASLCPTSTPVSGLRRISPQQLTSSLSSPIQRWTVIGVVLGSVIAVCVSVTLLLYFGQVCQRIKSLHYRWQVRYREVSGVEIAGDLKT